MALGLGVVLGLVAGGRPANMSRRPLELVSLLVISASAQVAAEVLDLGPTLGLSVVLVSYIGLATFAIANIRLIGMPVVLIGLLCNVTVIAVNRGMPVRASAIVAAEAADRTELATLDFGAKRHLADGDDRLEVLTDIVPVRRTKEVVSFGDLILAVGISDVVFRLLKPPSPRRRPDETGDDDVVIDLDRAAADDRRRALVGV